MLSNDPISPIDAPQQNPFDSSPDLFPQSRDGLFIDLSDNMLDTDYYQDGLDMIYE